MTAASRGIVAGIMDGNLSALGPALGAQSAHYSGIGGSDTSKYAIQGTDAQSIVGEPGGAGGVGNFGEGGTALTGVQFTAFVPSRQLVVPVCSPWSGS